MHLHTEYIENGLCVRVAEHVTACEHFCRVPVCVFSTFSRKPCKCKQFRDDIRSRYEPL
jgi:hypothetical protein